MINILKTFSNIVLSYLVRFFSFEFLRFFRYLKYQHFLFSSKNKEFYVPLQGCKNNGSNVHKLASWRPITLSWSLLRENASNERFDPKVDPEWESVERIIIVKPVDCSQKLTLRKKRFARKKYSTSDFCWWTNQI